jgi:hypothetical protein
MVPADVETMADAAASRQAVIVGESDQGVPVQRSVQPSLVLVVFRDGE